MKKLLLLLSVLLIILTLASCARMRCEHIWDAGTLIKADECGPGVKARFTCTLCGKKMKGEAETHQYVAKGTVPASCEGVGYTNYGCARCDSDPYIADLTEAIGHTYSDPILVTEGTHTSTYKKLCFNCDSEVRYSTYNETEEEHDYLSDVQPNFTFDIVTDMGEAFIKDNLTILNHFFYHTEYEDHPDVKKNFNVTAKGDNVYTISVSTPYEYDTAFIALLDGGMKFADHPGVELVYRVIEDPNHQNSYAYNDDIAFLHALEQSVGGYYPYKLVTSEVGGEIYLIVNKVDGLHAGQLICLGEVTSFEQIDGTKDCYFGLIKEFFRLADGTWMVSLSEPELQNVFDELDISYDQAINFDNQDINVEQIKADIVDSLYNNEEFIQFLSVLNVSANKYFEANGYEAHELANAKSFMENVSLVPSISFNGDTVHTTVEGAVIIPIRKDNNLIGNFSVGFTVSMDSQFTFDVSYKIKTGFLNFKFNDFSLEIIQTDTVDFIFDVTINFTNLSENKFVVNTETGELHRSCCVYVVRSNDPQTFENISASGAENASVRCDYCKPLGEANDDEFTFEALYQETLNCSDWKAVADDIKEWANSDKESNGKNGINLGTINIPIYGPVNAKLKLDFVISLDMNAVMKYEYSYQKSYTYGISISADERIQTISPSTDEAKILENSLSLMGEARIEMGLLVDMKVVINGLEKWLNAGISAEVGAYADLSGILNITEDYLGAYLEVGAYVDIDATYRIATISGNTSIFDKEWPLLTMGFENVYYAYDVYFDSVNIGICNDPVDIVNTFLKVRYFNLKTMQTFTSYLDLNGNEYYTVSVTLADGTYCEIVDGKILVKEGCPEYFTDKLIIKVEANNEWKEYDGAASAYYIGEYAIDLNFTPEHSIHAYEEATCIKPITCALCAETVGNPLGHDMVDATCTNPSTCKRELCGYTEGEALGHTYVIVTVSEATCLKNRFEREMCIVCGDMNAVYEVEDSKLGHLFLNYTYHEAFCEQNAKYVSYCERNGCNYDATYNPTAIDVREVEGTALSHDWRESPCDREFDCNRCGKYEHSFNSDEYVLYPNYYEYIDASYCKEFGEKTAICDICYHSETLPYNKTVAHEGKLSCEDYAWCDNCGEIFHEPLGHSFTNYEVYEAATCLTEEVIVAVCDHEDCYEENFIVVENSALGHSFTNYETIEPATCLDDEIKLAYCDREGCDQDDYKVIYGSALGHAMVEVSCQRPEHCSRCDEEWGSVIDCIESAWIYDKQVSKKEDGFRHTECTMCKVVFKEEVLHFYGSSGLEYQLSDDGSSYVVIGIGTCTDTEIVIPEIYNGKLVTAINSTAFFNCKDITSLVLHNGITTIGSYAFMDCSSLVRIEFTGTAAQWNNITKGSLWNHNTGNYTVVYGK